MNKYKKLIQKWESTPPKYRTRKLAHSSSKSVGLRSMLEVYIAAELEELRKQKKIKKFEYEPEIWTYQHEPQKYKPDFKVTMPDNSCQYYEAKGKLTDATRKKMVSVKRCNPDKDLKLIFERANNKLRAGGKMTYGTWADKTKIPWNEKHVKEEWL